MKAIRYGSIVCLFGLLALVQAQKSVGIETVQSNHDMATTQARLEAAIEAAGLRLVMVIDHSANAESAGLMLRPSKLFIFGNPNAGTPLMDAAPSAALDLPQKMLLWQDASGAVFVSYNNPYYLKARHNIQGLDQLVGNISRALANLANAATSP